MGLTLVTAPAIEPVTVREVGEHLRIDEDKEDVLLTTFIEIARDYCEGYQSRAYITQTWDLFLDAFPDSPFKIPLPPLQSITHIKYFDTAETEYTFASADYQVDIASYRGRVALGYGKSWPTITLRPMNGVNIRFIAGYGVDPSDVPKRICNAIKFLVGHLYENREVTDIKEHIEVPLTVHAFLGLDGLVLT